MQPVLIIKTGRTVKSVPASAGDFEHWVMSGMGLPPEAFLTVEVFRGHPLPVPESVSGAVITGSSAMVTDAEPWSEYAGAYARDLCERGLPVLGICYGHQLLARFLGGRADFHPQGREIGTTAIQQTVDAAGDPLMRGLPQQFKAHVTHSQSVLSPAPGSVLLADNPFEPCQALRFSDNVWGVQFHPEFNASVMRAYICERADVLRREGLDPDRLLVEVEETPQAARVLENFAAIVQQSWQTERDTLT